jgi:hypothetical protein
MALAQVARSSHYMIGLRVSRSRMVGRDATSFQTRDAVLCSGDTETELRSESFVPSALMQRR